MLELLRVEFRVIGLERDNNGVAQAERVLGEGAVYPVALDMLPSEIRELVDQRNEQSDAATLVFPRFGGVNGA